jgi:FtsP/CotA-like multicopper oxidase with cupredoxin domain
MLMSRRDVLAGFMAACGFGSNLTAAAQDGFTELRAAKISRRLSSSTVELWSFNGTVPGPVLRTRRGDQFKLRLYNDLDEPIAVHWHGVRLANAMDGTSLTQDPIEPGASFDYIFVPPDAGTFWYRTTTNSSMQRERGLYGLLIVEEEKRHDGLFDIPMVIDDWRLNENGELDLASFNDSHAAAGAGRLGNVIMVNGAALPTLLAPANRHLRLRVLNAANARFMTLQLPNSDALVIANDGQPARPAPLTAMTGELLPGQRLDLLVPPAAATLTLSLLIQGKMVDIATIVREGAPPETIVPAGPPAANPLPDYFNYAALHHVSFTIEGGRGGGLKEARLKGAALTAGELASRGMIWAVNGNSGLAPEPLFSVPAGVTVAITIDNITRFPHVLHLHGHAARLVEIAGRPVTEPVWRDTFVARPLEPAKFLFIADNPGKWLLASGISEHFETGLQAWFEVR